MTASAAMTRRSQASASSIAPPMHAPWIWRDRRLGHLLEQVPGLEDRPARRRAGGSGSPARPPRKLTSMPEENIGPSPRSTTQCTSSSSAAACSGLAERRGPARR